MRTNELTSLLHPQKTSLHSFLEDIYQERSLEDTKVRKITRPIMLTLAVLFSASAKIFYIPIALKLSSRIQGPAGEVLGIGSAICNPKAFFILEMWAANGIIQDLLGPKLPSILALRRTQTRICYQAFSLLSAVAIAGFSQVPYALPAADYNPANKGLAFVVSLVASLFIPTRSIQLSIEKIRTTILYYRSNPTACQRRKLLSILESQRAKLSKMDSQMLENWLAELYESENLKDFIEKLFSPTLSQQRRTNWSKIVGRSFGLILTGVFEYAIAKYTYEKSEELGNAGKNLAIAFSAAVTISTCYLYGKSITDTLESILNKLKNFSSCKVSIHSPLPFPKLRTALKMEEAITNLLALGPSWIIWGDFFQEPAAEHYFFTISICLTLYLLLLTASLDIVDNGITLCTQKRDKGDQFLHQLSLLHTAFEGATERDLELFLKEFPVEQLTRN